MTTTRWAALLTLGYATLAATWIIVSGRFAAASSVSVEELERLETVKGVGYVLVTAVALFFAARFALGRIERQGRAVLQRERVLAASERRVHAGLIASSVAHDSNNVLTLVLLEFKALKGVVDDATLGRLRQEIDRVVQLNRRLVQATRLDTGMALRPVDLGAAVRDTVALVRNHPVVCDAHVNDAAVVEGIEVHATSLLIAQIVTNLVVNAAEATGSGGTIDVSVRRDGGDAVIEVDDDGPGIPPERRDGIFDALVTTKPEGNGIGLFSVKASVAALGGTVSVAASPRGGARFALRVPIYSPPAAAGARIGALNA